MSGHRLLTRETLGDVLVNLVPLGVLAGFVAMFVVLSPYAKDPVYTTIQLSLVAIPAAILLVLTYYALKAVDAAERDAETAAPTGEPEPAPETETEPEAGTETEPREETEAEPTTAAGGD